MDECYAKWDMELMLSFYGFPLQCKCRMLIGKIFLLQWYLHCFYKTNIFKVCFYCSKNSKNSCSWICMCHIDTLLGVVCLKVENIFCLLTKKFPFSDVVSAMPYSAYLSRHGITSQSGSKLFILNDIVTFDGYG